MDSIVGVMKRVAEHESRHILTTELGIVTAVFPHADEGDQDNYQCSVRLKNRKMPDGGDFELRKVPVATLYMGLACIPNVGDLVLVNFIGGDINAPVVTGRLYNDEDRPPANKKDEFLLRHKLAEGGSIKLDAEGKVVITSKNEKNVMTVEDERIEAKLEKASLTLEGENVTAKNDQATVTIEGGNITIQNNTCKITIEAGGITIDAGGSPVNIKSAASINVGDATTPAVNVGGRLPGSPICHGDMIMLASHTHIGNLGAPCPIMVPTDTISAPQAAGRNTKVG